jgi:hypothetical protein
MPGALDLTTPGHLLAKLEYDLKAVEADRGNSYAAIDALRDAYHLREWAWHGRLESDTALQIAIIGSASDEEAWNAYVKRAFPDFFIIRDLCNGSKHFLVKDTDSVRATHRPGWDSPITAWDNPGSGWDDNNIYVQLDDGRLVAVADLLTRVCGFWCKLFEQFPRLS